MLAGLEVSSAAGSAQLSCSAVAHRLHVQAHASLPQELNRGRQSLDASSCGHGESLMLAEFKARGRYLHVKHMSR